jgi:GTP cyclohydrolase I
MGQASESQVGKSNTEITLRQCVQDEAEHAVYELLLQIGEDPSRDGLRDTPRRVAKAWREMTCGYLQNPAEILQTTFEQDDETHYGGMVILKGVDFCSVCEHHVLPFVGSAHIVYIPGESGRIVGISKLARLVDCFARRLQVQERMTAQIAGAIEEHLQPRGAMVIVEASHGCMQCRGVMKHRAAMVTSEVRGAFKDDLAAREEALRLIRA